MLKALSLTQPWATLSVYGLKKIETRSWPTRYRGEFAIHAAKTFPRWAKDIWHYDPFFQNGLHSIGVNSVDELPTGAIIGTAVLSMCLNVGGSYLFTEISDGQTVTAIDYRTSDRNSAEHHFGDYGDGRFMFFMEKPVVLPEPIPCKGALGFWEVPSDIERELRSQTYKAVLGA
jgi:hypothetical protein